MMLAFIMMVQHMYMGLDPDHSGDVMANCTDTEIIHYYWWQWQSWQTLFQNGVHWDSDRNKNALRARLEVTSTELHKWAGA